MIAHGKDIKVFCGNANPKLAQDICKMMGTKLGEAEVKSFADGEISNTAVEHSFPCFAIILRTNQCGRIDICISTEQVSLRIST